MRGQRSKRQCGRWHLQTHPHADQRSGHPTPPACLPPPHLASPTPHPSPAPPAGAPPAPCAPRGRRRPAAARVPAWDGWDGPGHPPAAARPAEGRVGRADASHTAREPQRLGAAAGGRRHSGPPAATLPTARPPHVAWHHPPNRGRPSPASRLRAQPNARSKPRPETMPLKPPSNPPQPPPQPPPLKPPLKPRPSVTSG